MRVFVPSTKRADNVLFSESTGLNILVNNESDYEAYKRHENNHTLHYRPELKGLLDMRNWILDQGTEEDPWILMSDDDILGVEKNGQKITFNEFFEEIKNLKIDDFGILGFNYNSYNKESSNELDIINENSFQENYGPYHIVLLNTKNLKNFRFSGYPGVDIQRAVGEDTDLILYCIENKIKILKLNIKINIEMNNNSNVFKDKRERLKLNICQNLWYLTKYRNEKILVRSLNILYWYYRDINNQDIFIELLDELKSKNTIYRKILKFIKLYRKDNNNQNNLLENYKRIFNK